MTFHVVDILIIAGYFITTFVLGFKFKKNKLDDGNYMLAARKLTLPAFVMTLVTTWYGAIFGVGEMIFGYGIVGWVTQGLLWYIVYFLFGIALAKRIHDHGHETIASLIKERIGNKSSRFAALGTYIMTTPAPYVLSLGVAIQLLFNIPLTIAMAIGFITTAIYVWYAGFLAVLKNDKLQFIFMYAGFALLTGFAVHHFGGLDFIASHVPATHLTFAGTLPIQTIVVWGLLALWTLVDPNFYQRCFAAQDNKTAQRGVLYAIVFWFIFDMMTLITGLYARAAFPDSNPTLAYVTLAQTVLPVAIKGIFIVGIFSIIISTVESFLFASASILAIDFFKQKWGNTSLKKLTRIGILITLVISLALILLFQSVIGIIYAVGTVGVSALIVPTILALWGRKKLSDKIVITTMALTATTSSVWLIYGWTHQEAGWPMYWWGIEPMYIGLTTSVTSSAILYKWLFKKNEPKDS